MLCSFQVEFRSVRAAFSTAIRRETINVERLVEFANRMNSEVVRKRVKLLLGSENLVTSESRGEKRQ